MHKVTDDPRDEARRVFRFAHQMWSQGDLDGFLSCLSDDVVYSVNVHGAQVAVGKAEVRARLELLRDAFDINAFVIESLVHEEAWSRSVVLAYYKHKTTGERLDVRVRFRGLVRDGLLARVEEQHDAAYVEAFECFVRHLSSAQR